MRKHFHSKIRQQTFVGEQQGILISGQVLVIQVISQLIVQQIITGIAGRVVKLERNGLKKHSNVNVAYLESGIIFTNFVSLHG